MVPFVFLVLQDVSHSWLVSGSGSTVLKVLRISDVSISQLIEELLVIVPTTTDIGDTVQSSRRPNVDRFLQSVNALRREWLDVLVRASWPTQWDLCVPTTSDTLQMKFELLSDDKPSSSRPT